MLYQCFKAPTQTPYKYTFLTGSEYSDSYLQWDWSITSDILDEWTKRAREQVSARYLIEKLKN